MLNNIKSFGMNVIPNTELAAQQIAQGVENAIEGLWQPILGYLEENDNVFSGQVMQEIASIENHAMRIGMTLNSSNETTNINYES